MACLSLSSLEGREEAEDRKRRFRGFSFFSVRLEKKKKISAPFEGGDIGRANAAEVFCSFFSRFFSGQKQQLSAYHVSSGAMRSQSAGWRRERDEESVKPMKKKSNERRTTRTHASKEKNPLSLARSPHLQAGRRGGRRCGAPGEARRPGPCHAGERRGPGDEVAEHGGGRFEIARESGKRGRKEKKSARKQKSFDVEIWLKDGGAIRIVFLF